DRLVFRLEPDRDDPPESTTFFATTFGSLARGQAINLSMDNSQVQAQVSVGPPPDPPVGVPTTAVTFPEQVTTDEDGRATAALSGSDPGNPRAYLDGQVYGVRYDWDGLSREEYGAEALNVIAVR